MRLGLRARVVIGIVVVSISFAARAFANETDNFTCRRQSLQDSMVALDALVNAKIREAVERANGRDGKCDAACLARELRKRIAANVRNPWTGIPHARLADVLEKDPRFDRCHLKFKESIYGARPYNQPWLFPFNGRIIFLDDSIRLAGRIVGIDKINHFIREGLEHWRAVHEEGEGIESVMMRERGTQGWQLRMNEQGLRGMTLTGVLSYADLAASYSGFRFWKDVLSIDSPESFVTYDADTGRFQQRRDFSFIAYVNDAWDEGINRSVFHPTLAKQVATALRNVSMDGLISNCQLLTALPQAHLYVNPECFQGAVPARP
jgi:hypothetical protein